ncbi:hypothetical protein F8388_000639 [Cannabis sativa]|uniref:Uncharacterized protein n=1 Tax=Cannabis sativa TaxID=3483 RepID=A0A7J6E957_CANSA|nr:hypothetical protein G4B88_005664 [Cannabis sativa]KAF4357239.1 hypothetical protein G4B88_030405 [Cannabis sativa]KAF4381945.1 hypothetical protein F8388_000639 [Cannabis sativa]
MIVCVRGALLTETLISLHI